MTKIKVCGLTRPQDIDYVNEAMPDYVGFVFADSRRQISPINAAKLKTKLNGGIQSVGVFVNAPREEIVTVCREGIIDLIQLHGQENNDYMINLKQLTGLPIIKAISVKPGVELKAVAADYYLFDQGKGGTGQRFDWDLMPDTQKPFFLAGGLNPENLKEAIKQVRPYAVDLSSGIEQGGIKNREKILQAVRSVRNE